MILTVASAIVLMAATPHAAPARPGSADSTRISSAAALRHYAQARLLEERGANEAAIDEYYRALVSDPHSVATARHISELAARSGDPSRSLEFARRALAADSMDARARWLEGVALFQRGDHVNGLRSLEAAARIDSNSAEYLQALAHVAQEMGERGVQERALERLVEVRDDDPEAWFQLAALAAQRGRFAEADSALDRSAELNPDRPGFDFLRGWVHEGLGRDSLAAESYRRHLAAHESDQTTRRRLVTLLARQQRFAEAYREAKKVSRSDESDLDASIIEAELAFRSGARDAGRELANRLEREHPDDYPLHARLIGLAARAFGPREGLAIADRYAAAHPNDYRGQIIGARAAMLASEDAQALARARAAVRMAPDSFETHQTLGAVLQNQHRWAAAESLWSAAAKRFPDEDAPALQLAFCREQLGDLAGAESAVRDLLKREPDNPEALNSLGYLLADHDRGLAEAQRLIGRALEQQPDNGAFVDSMGWLYFRLGRNAEARTELERAVELTGGDPEVCEHLGDVYKKLGLNELAQKLYRRSLQKDSTNVRVRAKLERAR
ncbi:MAG TPA: tetratricopeptide repeat protein [Candidatus Udaeobacter sp.]|jgi:tetratricopeptide (TPR) repeat protein|nr:tetratricopeptide repeat protein [Candidatus Udaeobacter sp.]